MSKIQSRKIQVKNSNYIDLIMFPEAPKHAYLSAKQILVENIESISSDDFDMDNDINTEEQSQLSHIRPSKSKFFCAVRILQLKLCAKKCAKNPIKR